MFVITRSQNGHRNGPLCGKTMEIPCILLHPVYYICRRVLSLFKVLETGTVSVCQHRDARPLSCIANCLDPIERGPSCRQPPEMPTVGGHQSPMRSRSPVERVPLYARRLSLLSAVAAVETASREWGAPATPPRPVEMHTGTASAALTQCDAVCMHAPLFVELRASRRLTHVCITSSLRSPRC